MDFWINFFRPFMTKYRSTAACLLFQPYFFTMCMFLIPNVFAWDLSFSGNELGRRLQVDRSAVSRPVRRVGNVPDSLETAGLIRGAISLAELEISQH
jgi:DNA-binding MarR family transcriptional regulator